MHTVLPVVVLLLFLKCHKTSLLMLPCTNRDARLFKNIKNLKNVHIYCMEHNTEI